MARATRAIAVSKQHGFHEPADTSWRIPEDNPLVTRARLLGIDVELFVYGPARKRPSDTWSPGNWVQALKAEISAIERSREQHWAALPSQDEQKFRIRAVQAERRLRDAQEEAKMLKERLKQGDSGQGAWVDERDALLRSLEDSEKHIQDLRASELAWSEKFDELEKRTKSPEEPAISFPPPVRISQWNDPLDQSEETIAQQKEIIRNLGEALEGARQDTTSAEVKLREVVSDNVRLRRELQTTREDLFASRRELSEASAISTGPAKAEETEVNFLRNLVREVLEKL